MIEIREFKRWPFFSFHWSDVLFAHIKADSLPRFNSCWRSIFIFINISNILFTPSPSNPLSVARFETLWRTTLFCSTSFIDLPSAFLASRTSFASAVLCSKRSIIWESIFSILTLISFRAWFSHHYYWLLFLSLFRLIAPTQVRACPEAQDSQVPYMPVLSLKGLTPSIPSS